ncbi:hypothetical protein L209DRAFT_617109 [Thermothelomyces heterothallicus CBS 203.75]
MGKTKTKGTSFLLKSHRRFVTSLILRLEVSDPAISGVIAQLIAAAVAGGVPVVGPGPSSGFQMRMCCALRRTEELVLGRCRNLTITLEKNRCQTSQQLFDSFLRYFIFAFSLPFFFRFFLTCPGLRILISDSEPRGRIPGPMRMPILAHFRRGARLHGV